MIEQYLAAVSKQLQWYSNFHLRHFFRRRFTYTHRCMLQVTLLMPDQITLIKKLSYTPCNSIFYMEMLLST